MLAFHPNTLPPLGPMPHLLSINGPITKVLVTKRENILLEQQIVFHLDFPLF